MSSPKEKAPTFAGASLLLQIVNCWQAVGDISNPYFASTSRLECANCGQVGVAEKGFGGAG